MITFIFGFLRTHWLAAFGGALLLGVAAQLSIQKMEILHLHKTVAACDAQNAELEYSNAALLSSLQRQNSAITALKVESDNKIKAALRKVAAAKIDARRYAIAAKHITDQRNNGDTCDAMRRLVDNYAKDEP
jgi:hypothetical protein